MKKTLALFAIAILGLALTGCNTTTAEITGPNGTIQKIRNTRAAWSSESYAWSCSTNGTWSATATKSGPDAATVQAFANLVGAAMAARP